MLMANHTYDITALGLYKIHVKPSERDNIVINYCGKEVARFFIFDGRTTYGLLHVYKTVAGIQASITKWDEECENSSTSATPDSPYSSLIRKPSTDDILLKIDRPENPKITIWQWDQLLMLSSKPICTTDM